MDSLTGSSSASLVSSESLRSSLENFDPYYERSRSNDLRQSFDSAGCANPIPSTSDHFNYQTQMKGVQSKKKPANQE
ncbi:hypothetical protein FGO68_gene4622 [Halteria grandinella]|uniref:Uncharacterized protein n=1 Tax=Halteria grandinella TaxID=5974 RepID=A0A8J8T731_HALGN|nr:hypothetical protein FGO68_gene4622 [Halteria grandinella]